MELNGLIEGAYDGVSWNCCPSSMAWHSDAVLANPGDTIVGSIQRVPGDGLVYETITTVVSKDGKSSNSSVLTSDMGSGEPDWAPTWAEVVFESYFVTSCEQLACGPYAFEDVSVVVQPAGQPYNPSATRQLDVIPWSQNYEIAGVSGRNNNLPICEGYVKGDNKTVAVIGFDCEAPH